MIHKDLAQTFFERFASRPRIFRSPGRINIIGEHTDYNEGFVLPAAVNKEMVLAIAPSANNKYSFLSLDLNKEVSFIFSEKHLVKDLWAQYIIGVVVQLEKRDFKIPPFNIAFAGDIPIGAGMSSSAALECATVFALSQVFNLNLSKEEMIRIAQRAENEYVGVNCGIMDQFASMFSKKDYINKLDCRSLAYETYQLQLNDYRFILVNSGVKHSLASSEYNLRRKECEEGVAYFRQFDPSVKALRDVTTDILKKQKNELDNVVYRRCSYVVDENERVNRACNAMAMGDLLALGKLMYETHEGLRYLYEVSCEELDFLVDFTQDKDEVLGSRMMGGGFGGCTLNLVKKSYCAAFTKGIKDAYQMKYTIVPEVYEVTTANGTSEIEIL